MHARIRVLREPRCELWRGRPPSSRNGPTANFSTRSRPARWSLFSKRFPLYVHGFSASSVFEARIADSARRPGQSLHCYSPAYSPDDVESTLALADYMSLNSIFQFDLASALNSGTTSLGLRLTPNCPFVPDPRYDPSRSGSKTWRTPVRPRESRSFARWPGGGAYPQQLRVG